MRTGLTHLARGETRHRPSGRRRAVLREELLDALQGRLNLAKLSATSRRALVEAAANEGVGAVVCQRYPQLCAISEATFVRAVVAGHTTSRAVEILEGAGLACAVLKGVAVAQIAWPEPALRPQGDLDLLLDAADVAPAAAALRRAGLAVDTTLEGQHWHHQVLSSSALGMALELHHELSVDLPARVTARELLARRVFLSTPDGALPVLAHEDAIVYLGLHAAVHALECLGWLVDIAGYAKHQPLDWMLAAERARTWGVELPVEVAWDQAIKLLGAPIPSEALRHLRVSWLRKTASKALLAANLHASGVARVALARSFRLSLLRSPNDVLHTVRRKLRARSEGHD